MKKRILSLLLALVLCVGMLPAAALAAEETSGEETGGSTTGAQLMFRRAEEEEDGTYTDSGSDLRVDWQPSPGYTLYVKFYLVAGDEKTEVDVSKLSVSGDGLALSVLDETGGFVQLDALAVGSYTVDYTVDESTVYTLPVTVQLPPVAFYSSMEPSMETYITEFTKTATEDTFYLVPREGVLTEVTLDDDFEAIADAAWNVGDSYAVITITGTPKNGHWYTLNMAYEGNTISGDGSVGLSLYAGDDSAAVGQNGFDLELSVEDNRLYYRLVLPTNETAANAYFVDLVDSTSTTGSMYGSSVESTRNYKKDMWARTEAGTYDTVKVSVWSENGRGNLLAQWKLTTPIVVTTGNTNMDLPTDLALKAVKPEGDGVVYRLTGTGTAAASPVYSLYDEGQHGVWTFDYDTANGHTVMLTNPSKAVEVYALQAVETAATATTAASYTLDISAPATLTVPAYTGGTTGGETTTETQLMFRWAEWDNAEQTWVEMDEWGLSDSWTPTPGSSATVKFYLVTGDGEVPVTVDDLTVSDTQGLALDSADENGEFVQLDALAFGNYTVNYAVDEDTVYTLPVTVGLPRVGFYTAAEATQANYAYNKAAVTAASNKIYLVAANPNDIITSVTLEENLKKFATVEELEGDDYGSCAVITINGIPEDPDYYYSVDVAFKDENGTWGQGLRIVNGEPHLMYYETSEDDNGNLSEMTKWGARTSWDTAINSGNTVKFYVGTEDNKTVVPFKNLSVTDADGKATDGLKLVQQGEFVWMRTNDFGEYRIVYTDAAAQKTYTLPVTVGLPDVGFYTGTTASEATYISQFQWTDTNRVFYFVAKDGKLNIVFPNGVSGVAPEITMSADRTFAAVTVNEKPNGNEWIDLWMEYESEHGVGSWNVGLEICLGKENETPMSGSCGTGVTWTLTDTGTDGTAAYTLTVSGAGWTAFYTSAEAQPWAWAREFITKIVVEDGVTEIGDYTFANCWNVTGVEIADSVTTIGKQAFARCSSLTTVTIPYSAKIAEGAFMQCSSLTGFEMGEAPTPDDGAVAIPAPAYAIEQGVLYQPVWIYNEAKNLWVVEKLNCLVAYPAGKTDAGYEIPEGVWQVAEYAFSGCGNLKTVTLPASLTMLGENAFHTCSALTAFEVAGGSTMFATDTNGVLFDSTGTILELYPAGKTDTSYAIPKGVTSVAKYAFSGCNLQKVTLPASLTMLGENAFYNCSALTAFEVTEGTEENPAAYAADENGVLFKAGMETLILYPAGKEDTTYEIPASVTTIEEGAFDRCDKLESFTVEDGNTTFAADENGVLYRATWMMGEDDVWCVDMLNTLVRYPGGKSGKSYTIPETVTTIGERAFAYAQVTEITVSGSWVQIEDYAFEKCGNGGTIFITFTGDSANMMANAFAGATAICYYPAGNTTWEAKLNTGVDTSYGGDVTWKPAYDDTKAVTNLKIAGSEDESEYFLSWKEPKGSDEAEWEYRIFLLTTDKNGEEVWADMGSTGGNTFPFHGLPTGVYTDIKVETVKCGFNSAVAVATMDCRITVAEKDSGGTPLGDTAFVRDKEFSEFLISVSGLKPYTPYHAGFTRVDPSGETRNWDVTWFADKYGTLVERINYGRDEGLTGWLEEAIANECTVTCQFKEITFAEDAATGLTVTRSACGKPVDIQWHTVDSDELMEGYEYLAASGLRFDLSDVGTPKLVWEAPAAKDENGKPTYEGTLNYVVYFYGADENGDTVSERWETEEPWFDLTQLTEEPCNYTGIKVVTYLNGVPRAKAESSLSLKAEESTGSNAKLMIQDNGDGEDDLFLFSGLNPNCSFQFEYWTDEESISSYTLESDEKGACKDQNGWGWLDEVWETVEVETDDGTEVVDITLRNSGQYRVVERVTKLDEDGNLTVTILSSEPKRVQDAVEAKTVVPVVIPEDTTLSDSAAGVTVGVHEEAITERVEKNEELQEEIETAKDGMNNPKVSQKFYLNIEETVLPEIDPEQPDWNSAKTWTLDITPMIKITVTETVEGESKQQELDKAVATEGIPVVVTIPLPEGFAGEGDTLFVVHDKGDGAKPITHFVQVQSKWDEETQTATCYVSFVNTEGFSAFTVTNEAVRLTYTDGGEVRTEAYDSLQNALDNAPWGGDATVKVMVGGLEEGFLRVPAGVTLDLNGHYVKAENVLSFGQIIDTADEAGGIVITNDRSKSFVQMQADNAYLPVYDTTYSDESGCYRFYEYEVVNLGGRAVSGMETNAVKFGVRINFTNAEAYELLSETDDSDVDLIALLNWGKNLAYTFSADTVKEYTGYVAKGDTKKAITLTVSGLDSLAEGTVLSMQPVVESVTGATGSGTKAEHSAGTAAE